MLNKLYILFLIFSCNAGLYGQDTSALFELDYDDFGGVVLIDSIVVSASRTGFDVEDFIQMVREDKSFYQAFRNIRTRSYSAENEISMFSKKRKEKAKYNSQTRQTSEGLCRTMAVLNEDVKGNFYKRKKRIRYYTAKMFDQLFFTHGKVCQSAQATDDPPAPSKGMQKHITELKKLIFSPGEKADVPIIGKKTEIFSKKMAKYYDYSITSQVYKDGVDCYVFSAIVKPEYLTHKEDKTVIKSLNTYFEKSNFQVVARDYQLKYYGALFDFDIKMKIELKKHGDLYVPEYLEYDGFWNVPMKKPEVSKFYSRFYDYE